MLSPPLWPLRAAFSGACRRCCVAARLRISGRQAFPARAEQSWMRSPEGAPLGLRRMAEMIQSGQGPDGAGQAAANSLNALLKKSKKPAVGFVPALEHSERSAFWQLCSLSRVQHIVACACSVWLKRPRNWQPHPAASWAGGSQGKGMPATICVQSELPHASIHCSCLQLLTADQVEFWHHPEKAGWMHSQGEHIKTWRKRWFVLKQASRSRLGACGAAVAQRQLLERRHATRPAVEVPLPSAQRC